MITPAYSVTATERVLPRLALDFTTGVLDARVTVTRALNTATRINSSGLVEVVNANLPRFDYDPTTLAPKGLLIEETRVNYILYSEDFTNAAWQKLNAGAGSLPVVTPNYGTAPDGSNTATRLQLDAGPNGANDYSAMRQQTLNPGGTVSRSIWAKSNTGTNQIVAIVATNSATQVTITPTWQRIILANSAAGAQQFDLSVGGAGATPATADISIWGAQLEEGAFATSYIPTTTTSLTRNADVVSMTGTNFSSWYNASEGALMVQADTLTVANPNNMTLASLLLNGSDNIRYWMWQGQPANLRYTVTASGASSADIANAISANTQFKVMCSYATNLFRCALNGSAPSVDTNGAVPSGLNVFYIGSLDSVNEPFSGHVAKINYYNQSVTSGEVQAFSK